MPNVVGLEDADAHGMRVAVVAALFNDQITRPLCDGAVQQARTQGVADTDIDIFWVPGAFEVPLILQRLGETGAYDAMCAIGAVVRGDTPHFDFVAGEVSRAIMEVGLDTGTPVGFGVLTVDTLAQAEARAGGAVGNKGAEAMYAALQSAGVLRTIPEPDEDEEDA